MNELRAYADGRWADFAGLEACTLAAADAQLGPRRSDQLHGGIFGGEPTQFAVYPGGTAAPSGVTAWILGDVLVGLETRQPSPPPGALDDLGQSPVVISSELGRAWRQELWPERGLVLHRRVDLIAVAFGLKPFDPDAWESDPLRRWRSVRRPSP